MNLRDYGDCEKYQWINTRDCLYSICGYFLIKLIEMLIAKMMMLSLSSSHSTHTHRMLAWLVLILINSDLIAQIGISIKIVSNAYMQ